MKKLRKSMALLLAMAMVLATSGITVVSAAAFSDTSGHWAESVIDKWSNANVINGYEDGTFLPDANISRAELAKVISAAKQFTSLADINFSDVSGDEWFVSDLRKCVAQGIIGGYEDGTFRPDDAVTREEAATMFQRAYKINSIGLLNFSDNDSISEWAKTSVTALVGAGVINGYEDGTFMPSAPITRAEVVKILDGITAAAESPSQTSNPGGGTGTTGGIGNLGGGGSSGGGGSNNNQNSNSSNVTLNSNGGKFSNGSGTKTVTVAKNSVLGSKAVTPSREGYIFDGWYTSKDAADSLIASKKWEVDSDAVTRNMVLYAGWYAEGKSIVSFEVNGGTPSVSSQEVETGGYAAEPTDVVTREHYTFVGWYADNTSKTPFDFKNTVITGNTRIYARWQVNAEYAASEINMPTKTVGQYQNGTILPVPPTVLPGEKETINIIPPDGFSVDRIPVITYVSSVSGKNVTIDAKNITDNGDSSYTFVFPEDVQKGSIEVAAHFEQILATPAPTSTPEPTLDPSKPTPAPTEQPLGDPTYYFSVSPFSDLDGSVMKANVETGGLTVSKDSTIADSNKKFAGSGYAYTKTLKSGTATLSFKVTGSCKILLDAVSASGSESRSYSVLDSSGVIGSITCEGGATPTLEVNHAGGADTITIKPDAGINFYGIFVVYGDVPTPPPAGTATPKPTPEPTLDPNIQYNINISSAIENGSIVVNNGTISSDEIKSVKWLADDNIPADAVAEDTNIFGNGKAVLNINGKDDSDGTITFWDAVQWYYVDVDGVQTKVIKGLDNPSIAFPFSEHDPGGNVFSFTPKEAGYLSLELFLNPNKAFNLYDDTEGSYFEKDYSPSKAEINTYVIPVEPNLSYYAWANGSKIGIKSVTYSNGILSAKAGTKITVTTKPNSGFKASDVTTDPDVKVTKVSDNTFTFSMPASDVTVGASFVDSTAKEYTATAPKPENGTVKLSKGAAELAAEKVTVINSTDNFLMSDGNGGKWVISADGDAEKVVDDNSDIGGNASSKMKLMDKAVQYVLADSIKTGEFEFSYDFYDDNTNAAGRSFRTYLDNTAHPYDETTGQATEFNSDSAFFHMMDVGSKVFVTKSVDDVAGKAEAGIQVGSAALEASKWYRVVIKGELGATDPFTVSYYLHGTDGTYNPDNISETPVLTTSEAPVTDGRAPQLAQIKFMRTASGNLYYDNIKLTADNGKAETDGFTLKAYNGETVNIEAIPDSGYDVQSMEVVDSAGSNVDVKNSAFVMPASDVTANVTFGKGAPATATPSPLPTSIPGPTNGPEPTVDPAGETSAWEYTVENCSSLGEVDANGKLKITSNSNYNGMTIYASPSKAIEIDVSNKTFDDGEKYSGRLKLGGAGTIDGENSSRAISFTPDKFGAVSIYFAHASSQGTPRVMVVEQNGIKARKSVDANTMSIFTVSVYPGSPVYIYGEGALNVYAVKYTKSTMENPPTMPPVPTSAPTNEPEPTNVPIEKPTTAPEPSADPVVPTAEPTAVPSEKPTEGPAAETEVLFESTFANETVGTVIDASGDSLGGMALDTMAEGSTIEIVNGEEAGTDVNVAKILKKSTPAKTDQIKLFWTPENGVEITKPVIMTAVVKNAGANVGTDMWGLYANSAGSSVNYTDKNGVSKTTTVIARIGGKGTVLKYTAFEEPTSYSGTWAYDEWLTMKVVIEPLENNSYKVTDYISQGIDTKDFKELTSRTITSEDGEFNGLLTNVGFLSGTQTSADSSFYVKSYKVEIEK